MKLTPRDRRLLQVLGAVVGLALVFVLVTRVVGGGDAGEVTLPTGPIDVVAPTGPTASPTVEPSETVPPIEVMGLRDPFSPPPEVAISVAGTSPTGPTSPTSPTSP